MVSRTAEEWYQITKSEFDPSGLIHLATDNAEHSIFTSLLHGYEQAREQGGLQRNPSLVGLLLLSFNVLKICSQRVGRSRNPGNSITACMKKQASSETFSPE